MAVSDSSESENNNQKNESTLELYISSGIHITSPKKRISDVKESIDSPDVIFEEAPRANGPGDTSKLLNFVAAPLLVIVMYIWFYALRIVGAITSREDTEIINNLSEEYDIDSTPVDKNIHDILEGERGLWARGHYTISIVAFFAIPGFANYYPYANLPIAIITMLLFAGVGLFAFFAAGTMSVRNLAIAQQIEDYAKSHNQQTGCLIVGARHEPGIKEALRSSDYVSIVE